MPNITVIRSHLFAALEKEYTDHEFDELCFEFGVEVDDVSTEVIEFTGTGAKEEHVVYLIAIPANRYDLLCIEGFARALKIFIGKSAPPLFRKLPSTQRMTVEASTNAIRPFCVCAVLRDVTFDAARFKSFIDLQDKLHQNICRKRTLVAIGTHDLDCLQGPFRYRALPPTDINFVPLTSEDGRSFNGKELLDFYREDPAGKYLKPYTDIIYNSSVYPIIYDSTGEVLSLPPIVNARHCRIQMHTRNVFIECTATDLTKANIVLDTMVTMFSEYCAHPFTVESVDVVYENPEVVGTPSTPLLSERECDAKISEINGILGLNLAPEEICSLCNRMQLGPAAHIAEIDSVRVHVPPTRSDILHSVDIIEDVGIAYGFNKIPSEVPKTLTVGAPLPINYFTDLIRSEVARAGYLEMLTHGLCSKAENFSQLRRPVEDAVELSNPANIEYEVVRTTLLPGAFKTLAFNKSMSHKNGVKLFEISDVVIPTNNDIGAMNVRKFVAVYASHSSGFEHIHGLVDRVMSAAQIQAEDSYAATSLTEKEISDRKRVAKSGVVYAIRPGNDPVFFPGMAAEVVLKFDDGKEKRVGILGVVHPEVLQSYELSYPCSACELDFESLM